MAGENSIHVMHVLGNFGKGGAEMGVVRLIRQLSDSRLRHSVVILGSDCSLLEEYPLSVPYHALGLGKSYTAFWPLARLFRRERVDVVHVNNLAPWLDTALAAQLSGARCVQTFHGVEEGTLRFSTPRRALFRLADRLSWRVTAVADEAAHLLSDLTGLNPARIVAIPNGIDTRQFVPLGDAHDKSARRRELRLPEQAVLFGCVAALRPVKNHRGLLRAFAGALRNTKTEAALVLVGDGMLLAELQSLAAELQITEQVYFLGRRTDVVELLQVFDAFVLNSDTEGLSYAVLEAMACGLPLIGTAVGANTQLVTDEREGFLTAAGDEGAMRQALSRALADPTRLLVMGRSARQKIVAEYGVAAMAERYREIYSLAGEKAGAA